MSRLRVGLLAWAGALVLGFMAVFTLGQPLPSEAQQLEAALHPEPPVTQAAAEEAAATIIRIQYPDLAGAERTLERREDHGIARWVLTYVAPGPAINGARISFAIGTGQAEVFAFP